MNSYLEAFAKGLAAGIASYGLEVAGVRRLRRRPEIRPMPVGWQPPGKHRVVRTSDGARLVTVTAGEGPPLVLSHGVMLSMSEWALIFDPLVAAGFRVIAYDHRGHGFSTSGDDGFSMGRFGDDLAEVLDAADARHGIVLGHSMGGLAIQSALERHPELRTSLAGVALVATTPLTYEIPRFLLAPAVAAVRWGVMKTVLGSPVHGTLAATVGFRRGSASQVEAVRHLLAATPDATLAGGNRALVACDFRPLLPHVPTPAVVLSGRRDVLVRRGSGRLLAGGLPNARFVELPVGHMIPVERPDVTVNETVALARRSGLL